MKNKSKNIKINFILILLFLFFSLYSQEHSIKLIFDLEIEKTTSNYPNEINFKKAKTFFSKKEWDSTLVYSMRQLMITQNVKINDYCHYFRANCFRRKKMFTEAQKEYNLISTTFPFFYDVKFGLGTILLERRKFSKAIIRFQEIEKNSKKENHEYKLSTLFHNLGICHLELQDFNKSKKYLLKALILQQTEKDTSLIISSYMDIANLYYLQYKDNQAIPYFEKAYQLSKKTKLFELKQNASKNMAVVEENRKDFQKALVYRKEFEQWKDTLNDQNKIWAIADYEKKYAIAQKQISVLKVENKLKDTQRNTMFFSTLGLLLLLVGGVYVYAQKVKNAKIILTQKNKLDELNATKDQLFSIVSHDLRSSVNALKTSNTKLTSSLETKNYNELDQLLHQNSAIANGAYSLLDNLLHWALLQTKQLYFHKDSVHLYSIVQQIEYNYKPLLLDKGITFENAVSKNSFIWVDLDSLKIILRNLLDNAIFLQNTIITTQD